MCAVCWIDPVTGARGTNATTQLCPKCAADKYNAGWGETWEDVDEFISELATAAWNLAEMTEQRLRPPTPLQQKIQDINARGIWEEYTYIDKHGHRHRRLRRRRPSFRAIARAAGCSTQYVIVVLERPFK